MRQPAIPIPQDPPGVQRDAEPPRPNRSGRRRFLIGLAIIVLLIAALVLPPLINISRYQRRISASLAAALGHQVEVSGITLQLLPRPGVEIANFVIDSNPGFSAEPILQCSSVTAAFRLTSLWRGRLEIARISLDEPSLNLERAPNGQWNFASVLLQAARTPQAPTGRAPLRGRNRFPYIEASNARVNFKHGNEKLPFSFMNADVSVWLENPEEWQLRFAAQPMRTDINLSLADTGQVRISGSVRRASSADQLPLHLRAEWRGAPLGQVSRMLVAQDLGWRGNTSITALITGVPDSLAIQVDASAGDFHRAGFEPTQPLNLHAGCTASYHHAQASIDRIHCLSPVGDGSLALSGSLDQVQDAELQPDLHLVATRLPADAAFELLRHTRGRLNNDIAFDGVINGDLAYARRPGGNGLQTVADGSLVATELRVRGDNLGQALPDLRFSVQFSPAQPVALLLEPSRINLGGAQPLVATARLNRQGYQLHYSGAALLRRLMPLAQAFNIVPAAFEGMQGSGVADYNLTVQGDWLLPLVDLDQNAPLSAINGSITLQNAAFQPSYLAEPVHIVTATASISPAEARWSGIAATLGTTRFSGSLRLPLACSAPCSRRFDLTAQTVNLGALAASLQGQDEGVMQDLINRVRSRSQDWPLMEGVVHIGRLSLGRIEAAGLAADLAIHDGNLAIRSLDGRVLGGTLHATGAVALASTPSYDAAVQLRHISAPELAQLVEERWGPGTINLSADVAMSGANASDLSGSANGNLQWTWTGGALPALTSTPLRRFDRWTGSAAVAKGEIGITSSEVTSGSTTAVVTGTIGSDRSLDLKIAPPPPPANAPETETAAAPSSSMTGTLAAPVIERQ